MKTMPMIMCISLCLPILPGPTHLYDDDADADDHVYISVSIPILSGPTHLYEDDTVARMDEHHVDVPPVLHGVG